MLSTYLQYLHISTHIYPGHCSDKWATKTVAAVLLGDAAALQILADACACTFSPEDAVKMWLLPDCRYTRSTKLTGYLYNCRQVRLSKAVVTKIVTNWFPVFCLGAELWSLGSSINKTTSIRDVRGKLHKRVSCWDVFVASLSLHSSLWPTQEAVCWPCPWYNVTTDNSTLLLQWSILSTLMMWTF